MESFPFFSCRLNFCPKLLIRKPWKLSTGDILEKAAAITGEELPEELKENAQSEPKKKSKIAVPVMKFPNRKRGGKKVAKAKAKKRAALRADS